MTHSVKLPLHTIADIIYKTQSIILFYHPFKIIYISDSLPANEHIEYNFSEATSSFLLVFRLVRGTSMHWGTPIVETYLPKKLLGSPPCPSLTYLQGLEKQFLQYHLTWSLIKEELSSLLLPKCGGSTYFYQHTQLYVMAFNVENRWQTFPGGISALTRLYEPITGHRRNRSVYQRGQFLEPCTKVLDKDYSIIVS